eukprot:scaffold39095_cov48-Attheya_sp.AAC.3
MFGSITEKLSSLSQPKQQQDDTENMDIEPRPSMEAMTHPISSPPPESKNSKSTEKSTDDIVESSPKKKMGRPKGSKNKLKESVEQDDTTPLTTPTPKKKKMGRPKGSKTKVKKIVVQDNETATTPPKKKKIGRPKGSKTKKLKDETTTTTPSPAKRTGRPKGCKNNKKHPVPDEKRARNPSRRLQETMEFDQLHHMEQTRPKRKYTKRNPPDTVSPQQAMSETDKNNEEEESDDDYDDIVCCLCRCSVDFSEREAFFEEEEPAKEKRESLDSDEGQGTGTCATKNKEEEEEEDEKKIPNLPISLFDDQNALLLCDAPGCNRAYHQRCHFTPVLVIPRGPWHCLLCTFSHTQLELTPLESKKKSGRPPIKMARLDQELSDISSPMLSNGPPFATENDSNRHDQSEWTQADIDRLYRVEVGSKEFKKDEMVKVAAKETPQKIVGLDVTDVEGPTPTEKSLMLLGPHAQPSPPLSFKQVDKKGIGLAISDLEGPSEEEESLPMPDPPASAMTLEVVSSPSVPTLNGNIGSPLKERQVKAYPVEKLKELQERFEHESAGLKASLLHKELGNRLKSSIDQSLGRIRQAQNTIRAYTETGRARKSIRENYERSRTIPQELVQCLLRMSSAKLRIRGCLESLTKYIQRQDEVSSILNWLETLSFDNDGYGKMKTNESDNIMQTRRWTKKELMDGLFPGGLTLRRIEPIFEETISSDNAETLKHCPSGELRVEESRAAVNCGSSNGSVVLHEKCDQLSMEKAQATEDTTTTEATSLAPEGGEVLDQEDNIICNVCFSGEEPEDNDVLLCDGVEYYGDEWEERRKRKLLHTACAKSSVIESDQEDVDDNDSIVSWNGAEDIFPEAEHEHMVAVKWKEGVRDELAGEFLSSYFGITTGDSNPLDISVMYGEDEDEEDSGDDEDFELNDNERKDCVRSDGDDSDDENESVASSESSSLGDLSSIECEIDKAELDALSACSSTSDSDGDSISENEDSSKNSAESDSDSNVKPERRTRRKRRTTVALSTDSDNDSKPKLKVDDGTLDTTNIVHGKRNRTKVDYRRLNDAMFGEVTAEEAAQLFGNEEDDEYRFGMETPAKTNPKSFSGKKRGRSKKKKKSSPATEPVMKKRRGRPPKKS